METGGMPDSSYVPLKRRRAWVVGVRTLFKQMEEYFPRLAEFGNFLWRARADAVRLLADRRFGLRK